MENSIKEDIKQGKDLMKELKEERGDIQISRIQHKLRLSINNILSDYKRVLKENEELKEAYKSEKKMKNEYVKLYQDLLLKENIIPVQKLKDIQKEKEWALESYYCDEADYKQSQAIGAWSVLQELIEESEAK